ncbi:MAG: 4-aminobutyrate--2-oxoglutarate transaminase [Candidatus Eremiobacteraeota bacterium]|nr:4-aminobutyrate--2-oxoglutarate transaminase [Candidatus Eremiobacteraeota bacterium]
MQLATLATELLRERRAAHVPRGVANSHPIFIQRAHGATVWDVEGAEYLDFTSGIGVLNLGHTHAKVLAAVAQQAELCTHACFQVAMYESYVALAEALNHLAPGPSAKKTLLLTTGAEATENAVKIAREFTRRAAVIAFTHGFHGRTLLALSMTGKDAPYKQHFGPFCDGIYHSPFPHAYHGWDSDRALAALHDLFATQVRPDRVAAIIIEPILGEGGFVPAPSDFLRELRAVADRYGIVLICDEVQSGFGRTGRYFATEHAGIEPDLITCAKSIASGLPLSAVIGKAEIMDAAEPGGLGGTYAGNPLACAAALATLEVIEDEGLLERAVFVGGRLFGAAAELKQQFRQIGDVRGLGSMIGIEFAPGLQSAMLCKNIVIEARERGLLLILAGEGDVIRLLPPLTISNDELALALKRLAESFRAVLADQVQKN